MSKPEDFIAEWKLLSSENYDDLMKSIGVDFITRKVENNTKPNVEFAVQGDEWTLTFKSTIKTHIINFKLNEEFAETTQYGRNCKVI